MSKLIEMNILSRYFYNRLFVDHILLAQDFVALVFHNFLFDHLPIIT